MKLAIGTRIAENSFDFPRQFEPRDQLFSNLILSRMVARLLKFLLQLTLLHCICGRLSQMPKFNGQDSAIIVDSVKPKLPPHLRNALYYNLPVYKLINPATGVPRATEKSTTTTPTLVDEYPSDLVLVARNKLGVRRMDQLPSLSKLGKLLGTGNAIETIKYVRSLTSDDQGIALLKSYLVAFDYDFANSGEECDNSSEKNNKTDDNFTNNADVDVDYEDAPDRLETSTTKKPNFSIEEKTLMQSVNNLIKQHSVASGLYNSTSHKSLLGKFVSMSPVQSPQQRAVSGMRPVFVRQPLPYHFPIPLRPVLMAQSELPTPRPIITPSTTNTNLSLRVANQSHLNTLKELSSSPTTLQRVAPHVQQIAQMANILPQVLDGFLQHQPKLAELAKRISRLPLVQQHSRAIDSQLSLAVKRALSQDESLKRLLGASQTLK